jgi:hypothetical protein
MSLFKELKRRNVIRMAVLYIVAGWVVLQIADVLFDPLGLPAWTFWMVLGLLLLGFPLALIFAWVFEMTPEGLKRERDIVVLLVVAIAGLVIDRLVPEGGQPASAAITAAGPDPVAAHGEPGTPAAG